MEEYAICNISGKQYKIFPNIPFTVDSLNITGKIEADVLFLSQKMGVKIGKPTLRDKITLEVVSMVLGSKIRVSKFHAKANYRRTVGIRPKYSKLVWSVKNKD